MAYNGVSAKSAVDWAKEIAIHMRGKWNKRPGERDTEKVKRIWAVMMAYQMRANDRDYLSKMAAAT